MAGCGDRLQWQAHHRIWWQGAATSTKTSLFFTHLLPFETILLPFETDRLTSFFLYCRVILYTCTYAFFGL